MSLVPLTTVQEEILAGVSRLDSTVVPLADALGLVLVDDVVTQEAVPPFANTAMDGYALRAADTTGATPEQPRPAPRRRHAPGRASTGPDGRRRRGDPDHDRRPDARRRRRRPHGRAHPS